VRAKFPQHAALHRPERQFQQQRAGPHRTACLARRPLLCVPACACLRASLPAARLPVPCHPWSVRPLLAMYALATLLRATLAYARHSLAHANICAVA